MYQQFTIKNKVCYLSTAQSDFEQAYISVRKKEERVLTDKEVLSLPHLPRKHPKYREWQKRHFTARQVLPYIVGLSPASILDIGCGNGWFTNMLAQKTAAITLGADMNVLELEQAARLFESDVCNFIYGDIFSDQWQPAYFDVITLNACVQYFPDLDQLITQLMQLLTADGEIHLLDSPFYSIDEITKARQRTAIYYQQQAIPEMIPFYHHHSWETLKKHHPKVLFNPHDFSNRIRKKFTGNISPFPWIMIKNGQA